MLDFKCIKLDNFKFNLKDLLEYYNTLVSDYEHMRWDASMVRREDFNSVNLYTNYKTNGWYTYAIHTRINDTTVPQPAWRLGAHPDTTPGDKYDTPTELMFGFAKKICDSIPGCIQLGIVVHPPGGSLMMHYDNAEEDQGYITIHFPIISNSESYWQWEDEEIVLEPGYGYALNTHLYHGTDNRGTGPRIHLICRMPESELYKFVDTVIDLT